MTDEIDGELSFVGRLRLRLHLWLCPPCATTRRSLRRTVEVLRSLAEPGDDPRGDRRG